MAAVSHAENRKEASIDHISIELAPKDDVAEVEDRLLFVTSSLPGPRLDRAPTKNITLRRSFQPSRAMYLGALMQRSKAVGA